MTWSIYKNSSLPHNEWQPCYTAWFMDQDVKTSHAMNKVKFLHDGWYPVYFGKDYVTCQVQDGQWARDTERKILDMVSNYYHGDYIEGFEKIDGRLEVIIGS